MSKTRLVRGKSVKQRPAVPGMGLHVIVAGNPVEGFEIYGPFKTGVDAARVRNSDEYFDRGDCWIAPLLAVPG